MEQLLEATPAAYRNESTNLLIILVWILRQYKQLKLMPLNIEKASIDSSHYQHYNDILSEMLTNEATQLTQIYTRTMKGTAGITMSKNSRSRAQHAIWLIDSLEAYEALEAELLQSFHGYQRNGRLTIAYTAASSYIKSMLIVRKIFRRLFVHFVLNVNILLILDQVPQIYTYYPYSTQFGCNSAEPELYYTFNGSLIQDPKNFQLGKPLFPRKTNNLQGCRLRVTTFQRTPYIYLKHDAGGQVFDFYGIDADLVKLLAELLNFTIEIVVEPDANLGYILSNGTVTGAARQVVDLETNITVALMPLYKSYSEIMQPTLSHSSSSVVFIMPRGELLKPLQRLAKPLKVYLWLCIGLSVLLGFILIIWMRIQPPHRLIRAYVSGRPFTNLLSMFYGGPHEKPLPGPEQSAARYFMLLWLTYTLILRTLYAAALFHMLCDVKPYNTIRTIAEAAEHYELYVHANLWPILEPSYKAKLHLVDATQRSRTDMLVKRLVEQNEQIATTIVRERARAALKPESLLKQQVAVLPESVYTLAFVMYLPKYSYLGDTFNDLILRILASGLMAHIESIYLDRRPLKFEQEPMQLSLWLLSGVFLVYGVLLALCCLVFLLEFYVKRLPKTFERFYQLINC